MPDLDAIAASMTSPEALRALCDEPRVLGAKKKAALAHELWSSAQSRVVGLTHAFPAPGGSGSGLLLRAYWDPRQVTPDLAGLAAAIGTAIPVALIQAEERAAWKTRNAKQNTFFVWQGMNQRELSPWTMQHFGVGATVHQLFDAKDLHKDVAAIAVKDGVEHLWTFTA